MMDMSDEVFSSWTRNCTKDLDAFPARVYYNMLEVWGLSHAVITQ